MCNRTPRTCFSFPQAPQRCVSKMAENEMNGNGPANGSDQAEFSGSDVPIDTPSSEGTRTIVSEKEMTETISEGPVSEAVANRRKDEYEVDFE
jgi:hypothetical protein